MEAGSLRYRFVVVAMVIVVVGASNQYMAGDEGGWRTPGDDTPDLYQTWASKIRFQVGDSIVFRYRNDSVVMVSKRGYYHCNETARGAFFRDGNTVFLLEKPGVYYFVSGDLEHCKKGQRLMIQVAGPATPAAGPSPSPLPSTATLSCSFPSLLVVVVVVVLVGALLPSTLF